MQHEKNGTAYRILELAGSLPMEWLSVGKYRLVKSKHSAGMWRFQTNSDGNHAGLLVWFPASSPTQLHGLMDCPSALPARAIQHPGSPSSGQFEESQKQVKMQYCFYFLQMKLQNTSPRGSFKISFSILFQTHFFFFGNVRISHRTGIAASGQCSSVPTAQQAVTLDTSKVCSAWEPAEWVSFSTEEQDSTAQNSPSVKHGVTNFAVVKRGNLLQNQAKSHT